MFVAVLVEVDVAVDEVDDAVLDEVELAVVLVLELEDVVVADADEDVEEVVALVAVESELVVVLDEVDVSVDVEAVVVSRATTCLSSRAPSRASVVGLLHRSTTQMASVRASFAVHPASSRHCCSDADSEP